MSIQDDEFAAVYARKFTQTMRVLSAQGVCPELAQEFAQGAWVQAWESRSDLRQPDRLTQWVNTIAINLFRTWLREHSREEILEVEPCYDTGIVPACLIAELISAAGSDSGLIEQFYIRGRSSAEIAALWKTSPLAIRVRLSRARQRIRAALNNSTRGRRRRPNRRAG
jgi:DNA-directed RNA polymerase specialized sigma24 family protein